MPITLNSGIIQIWHKNLDTLNAKYMHVRISTVTFMKYIMYYVWTYKSSIIINIISLVQFY